MYNLPTTRSRQGGFSLIEAAIVLGLIGVVLGGIWIAATEVRVNQQVSEMAKDVLSICTRAKKVFPLWSAPETGNPQGRTLITAASSHAGLVPKSWPLKTSSVTVRNCCNTPNQSVYSPVGEAIVYQFDKDFYSTLGGSVTLAIYGVSGKVAPKLLRAILGPTSTQGNNANTPISQFGVNACAAWDPHGGGDTGPCTATLNAVGMNLSSVPLSTANKFEVWCRAS